jgi:DNA-binding XRE family transcriptional regulator
MAGSTLARRSLGRRLRQLREAAQMSQSAVGRALELSPQSVARLEDGQPTRVTSLHVNVLCDMYRIDDKERKKLLNLAHEMREAARSDGGWWRAYADLSPDGFDHYYTLEATARKFTTFQSTVIPGFLQTADYRRAGEWTMHPQDSTDDVERRVEMMLRRQERLRDNSFSIETFLPETALLHRVGGPAVMDRQCLHLMEIGTLPNVSIRVVPLSAGSHVGLHVGSFALLEFEKLAATGLVEPPVVFVEGFTGDLYLERDSEIDPYRRALGALNRVALNREESRTLIGRIVKEYIA